MMAALYLRKNVRGVLIRQNHYHSPNGIYSPVLVLHILRSPGYLSYDLHGSQACRINHNIANIVNLNTLLVIMIMMLLDHYI